MKYRPLHDAILVSLADRLRVDANGLVADGVLALQGVSVTIQHHEPLRPPEFDPYMLLIGHFGHPGGGAVTSAMRKLLELNLLLADTLYPAAYAMDPATGDVFLCVRMPLIGARGDTVEEVVRSITQQALAWRRGEF